MKLKVVIPYIIPLVLLFACQNQEKSVSETPAEDHSIILSLVFDTLVGSKSHWIEQLLPVQVPINPNTIDDAPLQQKWDNEIDSIRNRLDTSRFHLFISENTRIPDHHLFDLINVIYSNENFNKNFYGPDSSYSDLLQELRNKKSLDTIKTTDVKSQYGYILHSLNSRNDQPTNTVIIGNVSFSRLVLNEEKDKACLYAELVCGTLCGYGNIYFLAKKNGIWEVTFKRNLWVS